MKLRQWLCYHALTFYYSLHLIHAYHRDDYGNWRIGNA